MPRREGTSTSEFAVGARWEEEGVRATGLEHRSAYLVPTLADRASGRVSPALRGVGHFATR